MAFVVEAENKKKAKVIMNELLIKRNDIKIHGPYNSLEELGKSMYEISGAGISIYQTSVPLQTTLLAIDMIGGKATIDEIMKKTGMARSTEAKNLSIAEKFGYVTTEKAMSEPRKKIYKLTEFAKVQLGRLPDDYKNKLIKIRINADE